MNVRTADLAVLIHEAGEVVKVQAGRDCFIIKMKKLNDQTKKLSDIHPSSFIRCPVHSSKLDVCLKNKTGSCE